VAEAAARAGPAARPAARADGPAVGADPGQPARRQVRRPGRARAARRKQDRSSGRSFRKGAIFESYQNVVPTAKRNVSGFCGCRLLLSTPARCGLYAKISRNGTFKTGMKNRISAPVDVLKALTVSMTCTVGRTLGSDTPIVARGSVRRGVGS